LKTTNLGQMYQWSRIDDGGLQFSIAHAKSSSMALCCRSANSTQSMPAS
jgi:hypothetical protein